MDSILAIFEYYWYLIIILAMLIILIIFYFETREIEVSSFIPNKKYTNRFQLNLLRSNKDFFERLVSIESYSIKDSFNLIQENFKRMLVIKNKLEFEIKSNKSNNLLFVDYISNPELRTFMVDPETWYQPFLDTFRYFFSGSTIIKNHVEAKVIFPLFLKLEDMIHREINNESITKKIKLNEDFERYLINKAKRAKRIIIYRGLLIDVIICFILYFYNLNIIEIIFLFLLGLMLIFLYLNNIIFLKKK